MRTESDILYPIVHRYTEVPQIAIRYWLIRQRRHTKAKVVGSNPTKVAIFRLQLFTSKPWYSRPGSNILVKLFKLNWSYLKLNQSFVFSTLNHFWSKKRNHYCCEMPPPHVKESKKPMFSRLNSSLQFYAAVECPSLGKLVLGPKNRKNAFSRCSWVKWICASCFTLDFASDTPPRSSGFSIFCSNFFGHFRI